MMPAIWFRYDLSPITVRYKEKRKPFYTFLTTVCILWVETNIVIKQRKPQNDKRFLRVRNNNIYYELVRGQFSCLANEYSYYLLYLIFE